MAQQTLNNLDPRGDFRDKLNAMFSELYSLLDGLKWKAPARIATTANITLSGLQTIDGILTIANDRVLVKNQSTQTENGIYLSAVGAWTRTSDANTADELEGATISVEEGTSNANTTWTQTTDSVTLGASNIVWAQFGSSVPDADASTKGIAKLYTTPDGTNTDGAVSQAGLNTKFRATRTVTGTDASVQTDDNSLIIFNSATPFNFTIDQLTASSKLSYVNIGAGAVTLVAGSGVTITGRTAIPGASGSDFPGGLVFWISATAVQTITGEEKEPDVVTASTAGGTITFDMALKYQRMFIGSASFATPKTIALSNDSNARVIPFKLEITDLAAVLTFPSSFTMFDDRWDDSAHTLTADTIGKYEFSATNYGDSEWILKIYGPLP